MTGPALPRYLKARYLKARANRVAHAAGVRHAEAVRNRLLDELRRMVQAGAKWADLRARLDAVERDAISLHSHDVA